MNDFVSPILFNIQEECATFWCFRNLMEKVRSNFDKNQHGMHALLFNLLEVVKVLDPDLYEYFKVSQTTNMFFAYRWM